jgi:predicted NBD/HSP70 family sugar kinase
MISLGIDIGGTSIKVARWVDGQIVETGKSATYSRPNTEEIVAALRGSVRVEDTSKVDALGICCPGILDRARRTITLSVNVPGLVGTPLDEIVGWAVGAGLPEASILSDAGAMAYDVYVTKGLSGRLLCLTLGTGVGASVLDEGGRFVHVSGESPGHFGQMDVTLDDVTPVPIGPDGGAGSLEAYIGAAALREAYGEHWMGEIDETDPPIRALVRAIRIGHAMYRPHHVCLTGGVGIRLKGLLSEIKERVDTNLTKVARSGWNLLVGEGDDHAACGAARYAVDYRPKAKAEDGE